MTQLLSDGTASAQLGVDRKVINRAIGSPIDEQHKFVAPKNRNSRLCGKRARLPVFPVSSNRLGVPAASLCFAQRSRWRSAYTPLLAR